MDWWSQDWVNRLESTAQVAEAWFDEWTEQVAQGIEETVDELDQAVFMLMEPVMEFDQALSAALDPMIEPLMAPMFELFMELDHAWDETTRPLNQTVSPILHQHPTCVGCCHYYGETHGGNLLVCAMHPYGVEDSTCPDWERQQDR